MPSFRRRASVTDAQKGAAPDDTVAAATAEADVLALAEQAEAEAAEAEALAAAARARAKALRLRREAEAKRAPQDTVTAGDTEDAAETEVAESDTDTDDAATNSAEPADAAKGRTALVAKWVAITLALVLTLGLLGFSGFAIWQHRKAEEDRRLNAEYAAAGRQSVVTLMSLNFNNAEEDVKRIIDNATGEFKKDFEQQAQDFVKVAKDSKVVTDVTVTATAVERMDQDKATVLVAATSRVTNSAGAKEEPRAWRLSVELQREGDQIKMSKVEFVP